MMGLAVAAVAFALCALATYGGFLIWKAQKNKHKCFGHELGRRYVPGIMERGGKAHGFMATDDTIIYGYTEISYKCDECGRYFNNRVVGKING